MGGGLTPHQLLTLSREGGMGEGERGEGWCVGDSLLISSPQCEARLSHTTVHC